MNHWHGTAGFTMLVEVGDRRLIANVNQIDSKQWSCVVGECPSDGAMADIIAHDHKTRLLGIFNAPIEALKAGEKFVEEWEKYADA